MAEVAHHVPVIGFNNQALVVIVQEKFFPCFAVVDHNCKTAVDTKNGFGGKVVGMTSTLR